MTRRLSFDRYMAISSSGIVIENTPTGETAPSPPRRNSGSRQGPVPFAGLGG